MAVSLNDKSEVTVSDAQAFGSYGKDASYGGHERNIASVAHSSSDTEKNESVPWFRQIGITSDPIEMKRIWSDKFNEHYKTRRFSETYRGRLAMRVAGRFFIGSAFFAAGGIYASSKMDGYNNYDAPQNTLQRLARLIDNTAGKAIEGVAYLRRHDRNLAQKSVTFRNTLDLGYHDYDGNEIKGRGLGHESILITFGFASMSFGDYMSRYFIGLFDKNATTAWVKGGHLNLPGGLKELGKNLFRATTYAAGEDIAAAIPYVYYVKGQGYLIDKFSPGFEHGSDDGRYGGNVKLNDKQGVIGDYNLEATLAYTGAFTVYNIITKMYRDLYASVQAKWHGGNKKKNDGESKPPITFIGAIQKSMMYIAVTCTKTAFYMIPSAFLFGVLRAPQNKLGGVGVIAQPRSRVGYVGRWGEGEGIDKVVKNIPGFNTGDPAVAFSNSGYKGNKPPWYNNGFNYIGKSAYNLGSFYSNNLQGLSQGIGFKHDTTKFAHEWANAAIAYTPYFMAKGDLASPFLDTNRSDYVLSGFYTSLWETAKSLGSFDGKKIKSSSGELKQWWNEVCLAMIKQPSVNPAREKEIQKLMNDEGYLASLESLDIYQGKRGYRVTGEERPGLEEGIREVESESSNMRPTYVQLHTPKVAASTVQRPETYAELYKKKEPVTQKSLLERARSEQLVPSGQATL